MTHPSSHRRPARTAALALALLALAACGAGEDEAPAAEAVPATGQAAGQAAAAAPAPGATAAGAGANASEERITMSECTTPTEGKVHFRVGESVFAVPAPAVRDAVPANMTPPLQKEAVARELRAQTAQGGGCPEKPLDATLLLVGGDAGHPLLEGTIGVLDSLPGAITDQFARLTRDLQQNPTQNCRALNGQLLACVGTETLGARETPVMYVITTDPNRNLNTGGPLAARCVLDQDKIRGCNIVDQLPGNVTLDATLNPGTYSTEGLAGAHQAAVARIRGMRL